MIVQKPPDDDLTVAGHSRGSHCFLSLWNKLEFLMEKSDWGQIIMRIAIYILVEGFHDPVFAIFTPYCRRSGL